MGDPIPVDDLGGGEEEGETFDDGCGWTCFCNSCPPPRRWWTFAEANEEDSSNLEVQEEGPVDIESSSDFEFPARESPTEESEIQASGLGFRNKRAFSSSSEQEEGPAVKLVKVKADDLSSMKEELASIKNNVDFLLSSVEKMEGKKPPPKKRGRPPKKQEGKTTKKTAATKKKAGRGKAQKAKKEPAVKKGRRGPAAKAGKGKSSQPKQTKGKAMKKGSAKAQEEDDKKKGKKKRGRPPSKKAATTKKGAAKRVGRPRKSSSDKAT
ncbi:hepatoma-derived growth factor-related protein 2-like [Antechinus flavipes]|uniref:hepatoma-derived growth factor-related protein 2-like n=1 Tax=Antechinus flavipes TaxID=38775 RepID=UPI002235A23B|nr:hepatoma-derived growth factor-related protein 2-like [Antechinus flavipes]